MSYEQANDRIRQLRQRAFATRMVGVVLLAVALCMVIFHVYSWAIVVAAICVGLIAILGIGIPTQIGIVKTRRLLREMEQRDENE